jgi:hypothetical protein
VGIAERVAAQRGGVDDELVEPTGEWSGPRQHAP